MGILKIVKSSSPKSGIVKSSDVGMLARESSESCDGVPKFVSSKNEEVAETIIGSLEASMIANSLTPSIGFFRVG